MSIALIWELKENDKMMSNNFPRSNPIASDTDNSKIKIATADKWNGWSEIRVFEIDTLIANKIMTSTSLITVTPMTVWVNGPFALSSCTIAMAEDGDLATKIVAISNDTATLWVSGSSTIKEMAEANKYTASALNTNVSTSCPKVFQAMLLSLDRKSFKYNSEPAAKAMKAREK